jgi:hypothetical protein
MKLNLHELINHPGYGKANEAVKEAGVLVARAAGNAVAGISPGKSDRRN